MDKSMEKRLTSLGYSPKGLWHIHAVLNLYECSPTEAMEILSQALEGDLVRERVEEAIDLIAEERGLKAALHTHYLLTDGNGEPLGAIAFEGDSHQFARKIRQAIAEHNCEDPCGVFIMEHVFAPTPMFTIDVGFDSPKMNTIQKFTLTRFPVY